MFQAMFLTESVGPLPWVRRSRQVPASAWTLHGSQTAAPQVIPAWDVPWAVVWMSLAPWPSMSCRGTACCSKPHRVEQDTEGTE